MTTKLKFPYGNCNYQDIITEKNVYIDRTDRIHFLENTGKNLLLLRPRRFGKSLLLSTLENYYDLAKSDQFEQLFGHLAIGQNPTSNHNQYYVMKWDFSMINPRGDVDAIEQSFYSHINQQIEYFAQYYREFFNYTITINPTDGLASFQSALNAVRLTNRGLYLLVDEYDNFANEVMVSRKMGQERYEQLLEGEGILKTLFKILKGALAGLGLERIFMTGVSPVVMSDLTSGQFVARNIYFEPEFNDLCGFREDEVFELLQQVTTYCDMDSAQTSKAMQVMRTYYDGYSFVLPPDSGDRIYNPTLVFYFLETLQKHCRYPQNMLDSNLTPDRKKLEYAAFLPGGNRVILNAVAKDTTPRVSVPQITTRFGVREMLEADNDDTFVASLLYYLGMLTLDGRILPEEISTPEDLFVVGELILRVPNLTVQGLYFERLQKILFPELNSNTAVQITKNFYVTGNLRPLCDYLEQRFDILDNRDYRQANELVIKAVFLSVLFNNLYYITDSETELKRGYSDLTMIVRPDQRQFALLDHVIEFKYVSLADVNSTGTELGKLSDEELRKLDAVKEAISTAKTQLTRYQTALEHKYENVLRLQTHVVVAIGFERLVWENLKHEA
ncbi:AAA family ATPase [Anaerolineales bacterium HSG6]|nr:AAA family ATPase [Anaerolineales bacterium HSG6]